jgi:hypothetical protein
MAERMAERIRWAEPTGSPIAREDDLRVPVIEIACEADLISQFAGALSFKDETLPWEIVQAKSSMQLNVDEKGVKFAATATLENAPFGVAPEKVVPQPRWFWFDRPFFLFLWRDGAEWPYAGVWFGTASYFAK